nr:LysR family transcriptional regulator [Acetobacter garciniae]
MRKLEEQLGHQLVERTPRSVRLSPAGEIFLQPARDLIAAHGLARNAFNTRQRRLVIGLGNHLFGPTIPALLARLHDYDPSLRLEMKVGTTREILKALDRGDIGAAFVLRLDETRRGGEIVGYETFGWMAAPSWSWSAGSPLPIAVQPSPCAIRAMIVGALESASIPWVETFVGEGVATLGAAVMAGLAVAALAHRVAPSGVVDVGNALHLPPLPDQEVVLYSALSDQASRTSLRLIGTSLGTKGQAVP